MINLLPPKEKEELVFQKHRRLIFVLGNIVVVSLVCLSLILFALKFYISAEVSYQNTLLGIAKKKYQVSDKSSLKEDIKSYNTSLDKINNFYKKENYLSDTLKNILDIQRPEGIYFSDIIINQLKDEKKIKISISGVSDTRDNLLTFKDNIERNQKVKNAYFPPDSWVRDKDINFSLTFESMVSK